MKNKIVKSELVTRLTESLDTKNLQEKLNCKYGEWGVLIDDYEEFADRSYPYLNNVLARLLKKLNFDKSYFGIEKIYFNHHCQLLVDMIPEEDDSEEDEEDFGII